MKTEVVMQRELFGKSISQKSKSEFFSATDVVRAGNKWRGLNGRPHFQLRAWLNTKPTIEFIEELEAEYGKVLIKGRGKGTHTWVHPLLFIDLALAISPRLKIEVYKWLYDHLIRLRNDSGDSYRLMCGSLYVRHRNQRTFPDMIKGLAKRIQEACGVKDWQKATEEQLAKRNDLHKAIALLAKAMNNNNQAIEIAFSEVG